MRALPLAPALSRERARQLRRDQTPAEQALWAACRAGQLPGLKVRRQVPLGPWIVDFAVVASRMIIEIDGETHAGPEAQLKDAARTAFLRRQSWRVIRFTNADVLGNIGGVLATIVQAAASPHPGPLPEGEGVGGR